MGVKQSKRSVDITSTPKKAGADGDVETKPVDEKVQVNGDATEKVANGDATATNGDATKVDEKADEKKEEVVEEKEAEKEKEEESKEDGDKTTGK